MYQSAGVHQQMFIISIHTFWIDVVTSTTLLEITNKVSLYLNLMMPSPVHFQSSILIIIIF